MNQLVTLNSVEKKINNFSLRPINLTIEPNTILTIVGDNGSGKSTLLKLMMGLIQPDNGEINMFGVNIASKEQNNWKSRVAYLPQTVFGYDSYKGNHLYRLISRWYPNWDEKLFQTIITDLQIPLDTSFNRLSPGMQQKLNIALTIPRGVNLLILDEPTNSIDIPSKKYIVDLLTSWIDGSERAMIMTSHHAEDIETLADYIMLLRNGMLLGTFEKEELLSKYRRFWINDWSHLPSKLPGEIVREQYSFVSDNALETEMFLKDNNIHWHEDTAVDLKEIITFALQSE